MNLCKVTGMVFAIMFSSTLEAKECVVLLHGWLRTSGSMEKIARAIDAEGFDTVNIDYSTWDESIPDIADEALPRGLAGCGEAETVHFVTHSMGGILVREYFTRHTVENVGRVVMLGPPNQGTEAVNTLLKIPGLSYLLGPAGRQLGTGEGYLPARLPAVELELGVIAGSRAFNPLLTLLVPSPDDGTVSVASTAVAGMCAHVVLPVTHFLMMRNDDVITQAIAFLRHGEFSHPDARNGLCTTPTG